MTRTTHTNTNAFQPASAPQPSLQTLLSQSEDGFYGSLQRIWNNVVQPEDREIIQPDNEPFRYAYR